MVSVLNRNHFYFYLCGECVRFFNVYVRFYENTCDILILRADFECLRANNQLTPMEATEFHLIFFIFYDKL